MRQVAQLSCSPRVRSDPKGEQHKVYPTYGLLPLPDPGPIYKEADPRQHTLYVSHRNRDGIPILRWLSEKDLQSSIELERLLAERDTDRHYMATVVEPTQFEVDLLRERREILIRKDANALKYKLETEVLYKTPDWSVCTVPGCKKNDGWVDSKRCQNCNGRRYVNTSGFQWGPDEAVLDAWHTVPALFGRTADQWPYWPSQEQANLGPGWYPVVLEVSEAAGYQTSGLHIEMRLLSDYQDDSALNAARASQGWRIAAFLWSYGGCSPESATRCRRPKWLMDYYSGQRMAEQANDKRARAAQQRENKKLVVALWASTRVPK